jgi:hypothetical protein
LTFAYNYLHINMYTMKSCLKTHKIIVIDRSHS